MVILDVWESVFAGLRKNNLYMIANKSTDQVSVLLYFFMLMVMLMGQQRLICIDNAWKIVLKLQEEDG